VHAEKLSKSNASDSHAERGHLTGGEGSSFICACPSSHPFFAGTYSVWLPPAAVLMRSPGTKQVGTPRRDTAPRCTLRSMRCGKVVRAQPARRSTRDGQRETLYTRVRTELNAI